MKRLIGFILTFAIIISALGCFNVLAVSDNKIAITDNKLCWTGRTFSDNNGITVGWGMTELKFSVKATAVKALIKTDWLDDSPYFAVYIDGKFDKKFKVEQGEKWYDIAASLSSGKTTEISIV